jgi:hypothetical protein
VLDKSKKSEFETDPVISALDQKINLGKIAQTRSTQQKDSLPILESRIIYKRRTPGGPQGVNGFSTIATLVPDLYLDPNEMARCREKIELAQLKDHKTATVADNSKDGETKKASHSTSKD